MNETDTVNRASGFVAALEAFAHAHPFATAAIVATVFSWLLTSALKKLLRALLPDAWDAWGVRTFDCVAAGVAAYWLLLLLEMPKAWLWISAISIGAASPIVYGALAGLICWKWPGLRKYLTLGELEPEVTNSPNGDIKS